MPWSGGGQLRRRDFSVLLGACGDILAASSAARSNASKCDRIGVLLPATADDAVFQARIGAFRRSWRCWAGAIGRNVRIDVHWASANASEIRKHAAELVALKPDVILATGNSTMPPLLQATRTVPIVFPVGIDPVANGYVDSLARPGGNATGFMISEYSHRREMARVAQGDRAKCHAGGNHSRCDQPRAGLPSSVSSMPWRNRFEWRSSPINTRDAHEIEQRRRGVRALSEWRSDHYSERDRDTLSRIDYYAGRPAQAACGLFRKFLCYRAAA